ncbi:efflux RND transporter periplasmic adaptor subunit [Salinivibrio kushneri]|uniref:efflux RND transporter periplasmic adaptor subunit n=1 Tax=Salinivibrio kushneri TaxID=1908198 RepID=UPI0009883915|nr:efflux RND transporter periplasmic adaptor subunit [Salinivibrio kushneri]OOE53496.1 efflux transporter periplasmic adaptor subunit [Salinivibrio kushneri]
MQYSKLGFTLRNVLSVAACVAMLNSLTACSEAPQQQDTKTAPRPALVEITQAQSSANLSFNGIVRASERAELAFEVGGRLTSLQVEEGDAITQGQLLASLDKEDAQTALDSANIELNDANIEYKRAKAIFEKSQAISQADLEKIKSRRDLAQNRVAEAKRALANTQLRSPFDGIVARQHVDNFSQLQANEPVLTVQNINNLEAEIHVPHRVVISGDQRTRAIGILSAIPNKQFPLVLKTFASEPDPVSQTYPVVLSFTDLKGERILPGMSLKVMPAIPTSSKDANPLITLPLTAVVPDNQGGQFVWVVNKDNITEKRAINIGELNKSRIVVTGNLSVGEKVIIAGVSSVKPGMEVRPYTEENHGAL